MQRDPKALTRVYGDYSAAVYNLCARILGDREEAKDVTQDVFLKAFSKPPAATEDVRLRAWLYRVATNACFNLRRAHRESEPLAAETLPAAGDPYEQARTAALIETSLAGLNERYRAALVLKDLHGLDGRELAEVLEVSRPAADVLVHRARASFRRVFARLAGGDAVAPANLALALPLLPLPAALHALPLPAMHPPSPPARRRLTAPCRRHRLERDRWRPQPAPARPRRRRVRPPASSPRSAPRSAPRRPWSPRGAAVVAGGGVAAVKLAGADKGGATGARRRRSGARARRRRRACGRSTPGATTGPSTATPSPNGSPLVTPPRASTTAGASTSPATTEAPAQATTVPGQTETAHGGATHEATAAPASSGATSTTGDHDGGHRPRPRGGLTPPRQPRRRLTPRRPGG